jgi:nucleoside-diphosphate-sugar epimerase
MPVRLPGSSDYKRQYTLVDDVTPHIAQAPYVAACGDVVNLGSDEISTTSEVVEALRKASGKAVNEVEVASTGSGVFHAQVHPLAFSCCSVYNPDSTVLGSGAARVSESGLHFVKFYFKHFLK